MNINIRFLTCLILLAAMLVSCSDHNDPEINRKANEVTFVSGINKHATRISQDGGQWVAGDQIGVYMTESGKTSVLAHSNIPYRAESSAQTTVFKAGGASINYPVDESAVDFIAYYPYSSSIANMIYPIHLSDQSASLVAHDLMFTKADNGGSGYTAGSVSLGFKHQLSKVILNLVDENNKPVTPDVNGVIIKGMNTTANFDLAAGTLKETATIADIIPYKNNASFEAILLPFTIGAGHEVTIIVDGNQYIWTMNKSYPGLEMKSGYSYTFKVIVKTSAVEVEAVLVDYDGNSIAPWGDGGADNKEEEPTEDIEIPTDYERISLSTGESISSALSAATSSKVAIVLANGGNYEESSGFSIPGSITSLMIVGEGGTIAPSLYIGSSMAIMGDMDLLQLYNLNLNGVLASSYFMNQESGVTIKQISFESCILHDMRGVIRLKAGTTTISSYKITNSIVYNIGNYNLLTVDTGLVPEIEITGSTLYNLAGRGLYLNAMDEAATVTIDQCTFHQGPKYAIVQFSNAGGSLTFTNNIVGLPYDATRGVSVGSNATNIAENSNYYVSDTVWYGTTVGEDCGLTASALFANPENGDFTQSKVAAGDPRWH